MKNLFRLISFQLMILCLACAAFAQKPTPTPAPTPIAVGGDDTTKTFEVRLPVTILDKKKQLVSGFSRNDFTVLEDGVPQEITFFSDEKNNPPVYVGVLMDTSASTKGKMSFSKEAAQTFLAEVLNPRKKDKAAFMTFDNEINLVQDFTDKQDTINKEVANIKKTGSQTALYDAIWQFTDEKLRNTPGRRVIVVITDGDDTFSRADLNDAIDIAQRTETTIFAISTKNGFLGTVPGVDAGTIKDKGDKDLERLCEETGGEAFFKGGITELERAFTKISKELSSQYIITYRPANQTYDGKVRKIEVRFRNPTDDNKKLKIRSKSNYRSVRDNLK